MLQENIHPTAIIAPGATIGKGTSVGAYSVIGPHVTLGEDCVVGSHVVIEGHSTFGARNTFFSFAAVGTRPQDLKYNGEPSTLVVGDDNLIREYVTLQPGTTGGGMTTIVGHRNLFMVNSHLGHDSRVGNDNVIANSVAIAGHVTIHNNVTLGGLSAVHQYVSVGSYAMTGGGTMIIQDIPTGCMAQGDHARLIGVNSIGLKRAGFSENEILELKNAFRSVLRAPGILKEKIAAVDFDPATLAGEFVLSIKNSVRGVCALRSKEDED